MRVKKLHQDPRRQHDDLDFSVYQEIEQAVKMHMENYIKARFPDLGPRKPYAIWKKLKDEEELIRSSIVKEHDKMLLEMREKVKQEKEMSRAKSRDAIRVRFMQKWRVTKEKEIRRQKHRQIEEKETRDSSTNERKARAKQEYRIWLQRKVTQSKEQALNQRKERLMEQQAKAAQELKAVERAEYSYQQWLARKQFEIAQKEADAQSLKAREGPQSRRGGPVLMAYSANRKGLSKELMTELSGFVDKGEQSWNSSNHSGAKVKRKPLFDDVLESDLGSSSQIPPVHLLPHADQSESYYEDDYEEESQNSQARPHLNYEEDDIDSEPQREELPNRRMKWQDKADSDFSDEEQEQLSEGSYQSDEV